MRLFAHGSRTCSRLSDFHYSNVYEQRNNWESKDFYRKLFLLVNGNNLMESHFGKSVDEVSY